jgi:hypothetical protein
VERHGTMAAWPMWVRVGSGQPGLVIWTGLWDLASSFIISAGTPQGTSGPRRCRKARDREGTGQAFSPQTSIHSDPLVPWAKHITRAPRIPVCIWLDCEEKTAASPLVSQARAVGPGLSFCTCGQESLTVIEALRPHPDGQEVAMV